MCRFALYTEDGDVYEFHLLKDAVAYARYQWWLCQSHSTVVDEVTHEVVFRI